LAPRDDDGSSAASLPREDPKAMGRRCVDDDDDWPCVCDENVS
jgi:hypothetical protein